MMKINNSNRILVVLHVADDIEFLSVSKDILEILGEFEVDVFTSFSEALLRLKLKKYDAIISEFMVNGEKVNTLLKDVAGNGYDTPVVVFTLENKQYVEEQTKDYDISFVQKGTNAENTYKDLTATIRRLTNIE